VENQVHGVRQNRASWEAVWQRYSGWCYLAIFYLIREWSRTRSFPNNVLLSFQLRNIAAKRLSEFCKLMNKNAIIKYIVPKLRDF